MYAKVNQYIPNRVVLAILWWGRLTNIFVQFYSTYNNWLVLFYSSLVTQSSVKLEMPMNIWGVAINSESIVSNSNSYQHEAFLLHFFWWETARLKSFRRVLCDTNITLSGQCLWSCVVPIWFLSKDGNFSSFTKVMPFGIPV